MMARIFRLLFFNDLDLASPPFSGSCKESRAGRFFPEGLRTKVNSLHARVVMQYEWILDVLSDLRSFAQGNGLPALAEQLGDTSIVAATEIARQSGERSGGQVPNAGKVAAVRWGTTASDNA